ncbi:MAG: FKBP-type peptidyl-prolyl cis-trans isomerase [Prevotella sp.]|jgi:FKBP-type peptidyl-prolyl cis-trans isomerase FklB|nr:FKBP-type peptidyl-prolyl cis-trans isomerase [Prevotella sp.]
MKKIILMALVVMTGASFSTLSAKDNHPQKGKTQQAPAQVVLKSASDSLSYAAGKASTIGLMEYLQQQYQVDTTYMADVIAGYKETLKRCGDPHYKAYNAGVQVATMAMERILPGTQSQFEGTGDSITIDLFNAGFLSTLQNDASVYTLDQARNVFETRMKGDKAKADAANKAKNDQWLAENKTKEGVQTTASGLQYKVLRKGNGPIPKKEDKVTVKYEGKTIDGKVFDSSYKRTPQTSTFPCNQVIKGWTEALTMMPVGSKWELYLPADLAYGERQAGQIKPYSTLIFTVELEGIEAPKPAAPATTQPATKQPAKTATKTIAKKK